MKKINIVSYILLLTSLLLLVRCNSSSSSNSDQMNSLLALSYVSYEEIAPRSNKYLNTLGTGYEYFHLDIPEQEAGQNVTFDYTFDTNGSTKDIYFIFSNISPSTSTTYPLIDSNQSVNQSIVPETTASKPKSLVSTTQTFKEKPEISEFNRHPYAFLNKINPVNMLLDFVSSTEPKYDTAGDDTPKNFKIDAYSSVTAYCTDVNTNGSKTLNLWVANNCGINHDQPCSYLSYEKSISDLADLFLMNDSNDNNDIYDWVTNIYGAEYGDTDWDIVSDNAKKYLITPNNEITILLLDIDNDRSADSGVLGYFWAKDNFKTSYISYSNERIMFYMDAYLYANHPDEIISALAHELQHMIHFYQKTVIQTDGSGTETWIDEMCSMAAEDLVSDKIHVNGPRGVTYSDETDGSSNNSSGRLPLYIYYNDASVTTWYSGSYVVVSYSVNYALGAYLSRNYGGAKFFHDVVHNTYTDYHAIEYALNIYNSSLEMDKSFGTILQRWGVASLLSNTLTTPDNYKYNSGTWFTSDTDPISVSYNAGSINMYNYVLRDYYGTIIQSGPYTYTENNPMPTYSMPQASNQYYKAADNLNGSRTWNIKLRSNVRMTVLAR